MELKLYLHKLKGSIHLAKSCIRVVGDSFICGVFSHVINIIVFVYTKSDYDDGVCEFGSCLIVAGTTMRT